MSQSILFELSCDLQRRVDELTYANYQCEKILRYLDLCSIENVCDQHHAEKEVKPTLLNTVPSPSEPIGTHDIQPDPSQTLRPLAPITNSLEDVLNLAREIREKKAGGKVIASHVITPPVTRSIRNVDSKIARYGVNAARQHQPCIVLQLLQIPTVFHISFSAQLLLVVVQYDSSYYCLITFIAVN